MTKITAFTKQNLPLIRADIDGALAALEAKWGVSFKMGNITFGEKQFSGKLIAAIDTDGTVTDPREVKWADDYKRYSGLYKMPIALLGKTVIYNGRDFTLLGYNTRGKNYPIMAREKSSGKMFKLPRSAVGGYDPMKKFL